jgi:hypothetical protein
MEDNTMMINEELAKRNHDNYSMFDYKAGSETASYNSVIAEAAAKIEKAKAKVSPEGQERLDRLLESFKVKYADWVNRSNANGAKHVSVMISGASNYNMRAHEKYLNRENKLWAEYDDIKDIDSKIYTIINGDKIIKSDDENAIEKLKEKLAKALEEHEGYKTHNATARKEGKETLPAYVLQNSNGRIKGIKDRIAHLERIAAKAAVTPQVEVTVETNGIKIIDNLEAQRLQIIFPDKPEASIREQLKKNGFRWCPTAGAWQSYRSDRAERIARQIVKGA